MVSDVAPALSLRPEQAVHAVGVKDVIEPEMPAFPESA
jgi:hypothetical protein